MGASHYTGMQNLFLSPRLVHLTLIVELYTLPQRARPVDGAPSASIMGALFSLLAMLG